MSDTSPKPFVFVLMPFKPEFDDIYQFGIKAACNDAGTYCERVDEQVFEGSILDRIFNQISKADIIIADMTGQNSNVFFETGYALGLGKRYILLTQKVEDIPFDLKHYTHTIYGGSIASLKSELEKKVRYFMEHTEAKVIAPVESLEFYIAGEKVRERSIIDIELPVVGQTVRGRFIAENVDLSFAVNNISQKSVDISGFQFAVVFPEDFAEPTASTSSFVRLPGSKLMYVSRPLHLDLFPGGWHTDQIMLINYSPDTARGKLHQCQVQILNAFGKKDINFAIYVPPKTEPTKPDPKEKAKEGG